MRFILFYPSFRLLVYDCFQTWPKNINWIWLTWQQSYLINKENSAHFFWMRKLFGNDNSESWLNYYLSKNLCNKAFIQTIDLIHHRSKQFLSVLLCLTDKPTVLKTVQTLIDGTTISNCTFYIFWKILKGENSNLVK